LPQFRVFVAFAFASVLFGQAALADGTGKGNGSGGGNPPPDSKTWTGFGWGLGIAADFDLGGKRVTGAQIDNANIVRVTDTSGQCRCQLRAGGALLRVRVADWASLVQKS
jgi:hypothetical protein